jgi:nitrile hydratase accessory protein
MSDARRVPQLGGDVPPIPADVDGPVFREPWEAQAFALTLRLHEAGAFTWQEWTDALSAEIREAREAGEPDTGERYYHFWLHALEELLETKGVVSHAQLEERREYVKRTRPTGHDHVARRDPVAIAASTRRA